MKRIDKVPKIWFFDMEGTILKKNHELDNGKVAPSAWTVLAKILGEECFLEEEETKNKWLRGEYKGYLDWMRDTVLIHEKYGLNQAILEKVIGLAEFHDGVHELFDALRSKGIITAMVTGGFKALADKVQRKLKIDHVFSGCEYFFSETGEFEFFNLLPADNDGKVSFMLQIAREHGIKPSECLFIGDGKNDTYLAREVGISIAFNAQSELENIASISIRQPRDNEDLSEVMEFFPALRS